MARRRHRRARPHGLERVGRRGCYRSPSEGRTMVDLGKKLLGGAAALSILVIACTTTVHGTGGGDGAGTDAGREDGASGAPDERPGDGDAGAEADRCAGGGDPPRLRGMLRRLRRGASVQPDVHRLRLPGAVQGAVCGDALRGRAPGFRPRVRQLPGVPDHHRRLRPLGPGRVRRGRSVHPLHEVRLRSEVSREAGRVIDESSSR